MKSGASLIIPLDLYTTYRREAKLANVGATSASSRVANVTTPDIQNISVTAATEAIITFPTNTTRFIIRHRDLDGFEIRTSTAAANYYTIECGNDYREAGLTATTSYTFYITPETSGILEVFSWS
jgi:hypothetical protein